MNVHPTVTLKTALGNHPHTLPLKQGLIKSPSVAFDFVEIEPVNRAFKLMVRENAFDVCEMAIVTALQACAFNKPLALLPVVMMGRFQHGTMFYESTRGTIGVGDLEGKRIGVRAWTQTTGAWIRGMLSKDYGVDLKKIHWTTFEDAHIPEYKDPPEVVRAPAGKQLLKMLLDGELDVGIFGGDLPKNPELKSVIPNYEKEADAWYQKYKVVPINHMVMVKQELVDSNPAAVREVFRLLHEGKKAAQATSKSAYDFIPFGVEACRPGIELMAEFAEQQQLTPRRLSVDGMFDATTRALGV
jgi:4,5-dihydroxyphthalate decarboxylase